MREFIYNSWNGVMDSNYNPLRHIPDLNTRHLILQVLAWMWCIVFAIMVGSWTVFGVSAVVHVILLAAIKSGLNVPAVNVPSISTLPNEPVCFKL